MKKLTAVLSLAIIAACLVFDAGCSKTTLDQSGPYAGDKFLYDADGAVIDARHTVDAATTWEMENRGALAAAGKQSVTAAIDSIRTTAPTYFGLVKQARAQYVAAKGPGTSNSFFQALSVLQTQTLATKALTNSAKLTP